MSALNFHSPPANSCPKYTRKGCSGQESKHRTGHYFSSLTLSIPPIKHCDLRGHREGPRASPLQDLFFFNGLPCLPLPPNLFLSCSLALPGSALPFPKGQSVCQGGKMPLAEKMVKRLRERATLAEGEEMASDGRGCTGRYGVSWAPTWLLLGTGAC